MCRRFDPGPHHGAKPRLVIVDKHLHTNKFIDKKIAPGFIVGGFLFRDYFQGHNLQSQLTIRILEREIRIHISGRNVVPCLDCRDC